MSYSKSNIQRNNHGFTLIELFIAMTVASIVMLSVFVIYKNHQQHYLNQLDVTQMQQNLRGALNILSRDIRMAGYTEYTSSTASIETADDDCLYFTQDSDEDGFVDTYIAYNLDTTDDVPKLRRITSDSEITDFNPVSSDDDIAEYIEHLEFLYLDSNGAPTNTPANVKTVVVTIIARAEHEDPYFNNNMTYTPASNLDFYVSDSSKKSGTTWDKGDHYRRRMEIITIRPRNL